MISKHPSRKPSRKIASITAMMAPRCRREDRRARCHVVAAEPRKTAEESPDQDQKIMLVI
jgi:hypothetical protein